MAAAHVARSREFLPGHVSTPFAGVDTMAGRARSGQQLDD
jgi:hypothetical protein